MKRPSNRSLARKWPIDLHVEGGAKEELTTQHWNLATCQTWMVVLLATIAALARSPCRGMGLARRRSRHEIQGNPMKSNKFMKSMKIQVGRSMKSMKSRDKKRKETSSSQFLLHTSSGLSVTQGLNMASTCVKVPPLGGTSPPGTSQQFPIVIHLVSRLPLWPLNNFLHASQLGFNV